MNKPPTYSSVDDVDIGALWRAVADRRGYLLGVAITAGLLTLIALQLVTPLYTSQARVLIEHDEPAFMRPRAELGTSDRSVLLNPEAVASQVQVLLSRDLAYQVVKELKLGEKGEFNRSSGPGAALKKIFVALGLARAPTLATREERALDNFAERLSVYQIAKSRVIAIEFDSWDARLAASVANRLAELYLTWQQKVKLDQTRDASHWLSEQIKTLRKEVATSEAAIEKHRSTSGIIAGSNNVRLDDQQLSELNSQLILARAQRSEAEARAALIRKMLKEKGDVAAAPDVLRSALIQRLLEQRVRLRRELAELSATLLPSHPRIKQLNSELTDLQRQIRQEAQKVVGSLENEAQIAGAREASLRASLDDLKARTSANRSNEIKLRSLEREAKANRDLLESYLARYGEASARSDKSSVPAHASIISRAHVSLEPSFPKKGPVSALVAAAVGLLALAGIVARELITGAHAASGGGVRRMTPAQEFRTHNAVPEPETVPLPRRGGGMLRAKSARAAAKMIGQRLSGGLAHNAVIAADNHRGNSAQDALDIGRALASSGLSVALVDFSTAGPGVAGLVGLSNIPGLGELLSGAARFEDVVSADPEGGVQIIPSGVLPQESFAQKDQPQWRRVHEALAQIYDCILLHTSLSGARRLVGGLQTEDTTILLVSEGKASAAQIRQLTEYLAPNAENCPEIISYRGAASRMQDRAQTGFVRHAAMAR